MPLAPLVVVVRVEPVKPIEPTAAYRSVPVVLFLRRRPVISWPCWVCGLVRQGPLQDVPASYEMKTPSREPTMRLLLLRGLTRTLSAARYCENGPSGRRAQVAPWSVLLKIPAPPYRYPYPISPVPAYTTLLL